MPRLIIAGDDNVVRQMDAATGSMIGGTFTGTCADVAVGTDGTVTMATGTQGGTVTVLPLGTPCLGGRR